MFFKTGDLKKSAIFTRKHLCWSLFLKKVALKFFTKKRLQHRYFPVNIVKILRTAFVIKDQWLLSTWPYFILWMINDFIKFSSCAMLKACVSIITKLQLQINRYKRENKKFSENVYKSLQIRLYLFHFFCRELEFNFLMSSIYVYFKEHLIFLLSLTIYIKQKVKFFQIVFAFTTFSIVT